MTQEAEGELETGYNSGDEYVPPKHPENIQEVIKLRYLSITKINRYCLLRLYNHIKCRPSTENL